MGSLINFGDIVAVIGLAYRTIRLLSNSRRAPDEYQSLCRELVHLGLVLDNVRRVVITNQQRSGSCILPSPPDSGTLDLPVSIDTNDLGRDVDESMGRCKVLLEAFNSRVQGYEQYLSGSTSANRIVATWKRICWAALMKKQVTKLRCKLSHERETLTLLISSILLSSTDRMAEMMSQQIAISRDTCVSVHRLRLLIEPSGSFLWLIDASSNRIGLPFGLCSTWQSFEMILKSYFRGRAVIGYLAHGDLEFMTEDNQEIISPATWENLVKPNTTVGMSVIIRTSVVDPAPQKCPSCGAACATTNGIHNDHKAVIQCSSCGTIIRITNQIDQDGTRLDWGCPPTPRKSTSPSQPDLKQLRRFRIINIISKKIQKKGTINPTSNMAIHNVRRHSRAPVVVLTIPSKHSWMVSAEIRHRGVSFSRT